MSKVSVIVPIFNAERHLEKCIDSILAQTLKEIEVILVDDGSTDTSLSIAERYCKKDERVQVLTQQNQFAGVARNNGLKKASGEYVIFWDSDDYFDERALECLYEEAKRCNADICVGEAVKINMVTGEAYANVHYLHEKRMPEKRPFSINDIPQFIFNFSNNFPWNKLYRREFIGQEQLEFQNIRRANDVFFVMAAFAVAKRITTVNQIIVYYQFKNEGSLSVNAVNNKEYVYEAFSKVKKFLVEKNFWQNEDVRRSYVNKAYSSISSQFFSVMDTQSFKELLDYYKSILAELGIENCSEEQIYVSKHYRELSHMLKDDLTEFIFDQYLYYREENTNNLNKYVDMRERFKELRKDEDKFSRLLEQQKEKNERIKESLERQKKKNIDLKNKVSEQKDILKKRNQLIKTQEKYLQRRLVKLALKIHGIRVDSDNNTQGEE